MSQLFVDTIRNRDGNGAPVFDKGIVISGIITASGSLGGESVSIGLTEVISSAFQLKNVLSLDAITTASIEAAVSAAPNDFTSLNVSGISTFGNDVDLNADIDIFGHTEINTLNASGILTATVLSTGAEGSAIRISSNTISGPATLTIDPAGIGTNTGTVVIQGDLQVEGDTTTVNSTTLTIDDKNIILASGSLTDASSDGGGITLESGEGNKTINWVNSTDSWTFSENIDLASGKTFKINGVDVLSATTLGSSVVNSSITSLGSLTALNVTGDLDVDGHTNLDNVSIAGVVTATTFVGDGDFVELDVDGHTNLDNVSIAGVSTFSSDVITGTGATVGFGSTAFFKDSARAVFGDGGDLEIYHDGDSYIKNTNATSNLFINSALGLQLRVNSSEVALSATSGAQVELFHANSKKFETIGTGVTVTGTTFSTGLDVSANSTFGGDIDVDGHTNLDNVTVGGAITATTFTGDLSGEVSTAAQPNITSLGTLTGLTVSGNITAQADLDVDGHTNLDNVSIVGVATVGLTTVLETGILTHDVNVSGVSTFNGDIKFGDNIKATFGADDDLQIRHNGTNSEIVDSGTGNLNLGGDVEVGIYNAALDSCKAKFLTGNAAILYYNNIEKFATAGSGATVYGTLTTTDLTVSGDIDVDGHTNLDNVSVAGVTTFTSNIDADGNLDVDGTTELDVLNVAETATFSSNIDANGDLDVDGHTELDNVNISGVTTFASNIDANKSLDVAGNLNTLTFRAGLSTFTGFVYNELDTNTSLRNAADFNNIAGVAFTSGVVDILYWDFATAPSVIGGEADNGITTIELASLPTDREYMVRATLITFTDNANDWDTGNVVVKVNGQTPTNYLWRNGAQPVGTTTGSSNAFDIVEFKIVHDTNNEFSVFAEWSAYHAST